MGWSRIRAIVAFELFTTRTRPKRPAAATPYYYYRHHHHHHRVIATIMQRKRDPMVENRLYVYDSSRLTDALSFHKNLRSVTMMI